MTARHRREETVQRELEQGLSTNALITLQEFMEFYEAVSAVIDDDRCVVNHHRDSLVV